MPGKCFVALKSKTYIFIKEDNHELKKQKTLIKKCYSWWPKYEDHENLLFNRSYMRHEMKRIQSKDHNIGSFRINNIYLSSDDKKYICIYKDGYSRISCFHKLTC